MSGIYNKWYKVEHSHSPNDIIQMESGGFQKPFYFGGSQVPVNLSPDYHIHQGKGISDYSKMNFKPSRKGKTSQLTNHHSQTNIHLPRSMSSV